MIETVRGILFIKLDSPAEQRLGKLAVTASHMTTHIRLFRQLQHWWFDLLVVKWIRVRVGYPYQNPNHNYSVRLVNWIRNTKGWYLKITDLSSSPPWQCEMSGGIFLFSSLFSAFHWVISPSSGSTGPICCWKQSRFRWSGNHVICFPFIPCS